MCVITEERGDSVHARREEYCRNDSEGVMTQYALDLPLSVIWGDPTTWEENLGCGSVWENIWSQISRMIQIIVERQSIERTTKSYTALQFIDGCLIA